MVSYTSNNIFIYSVSPGIHGLPKTLNGQLRQYKEESRFIGVTVAIGYGNQETLLLTTGIIKLESFDEKELLENVISDSITLKEMVSQIEMFWDNIMNGNKTINSVILIFFNFLWLFLNNVLVNH